MCNKSAFLSILCSECCVRFYVDPDSMLATCPVCGCGWSYDLKTQKWELKE